MQDKKAYTRVFVGNIPYSANEKKVREHMEKVGEVVSVELFLDEVGVSRGCGIIEYVSASDSLKAIDLLHHTRIDGRMITVKEDDSHSYSKRRLGSTCVKLKNLPPSVTYAQLRDLGSCFGTVLKAEVMLDGIGRSRGTGTITFGRTDETNNACAKLNKAIFNDREIVAYIDINENNK